MVGTSLAGPNFACTCCHTASFTHCMAACSPGACLVVQVVSPLLPRQYKAASVAGCIFSFWGCLPRGPGSSDLTLDWDVLSIVSVPSKYNILVIFAPPTLSISKLVPGTNEVYSGLHMLAIGSWPGIRGLPFLMAIERAELVPIHDISKLAPINRLWTFILSPWLLGLSNKASVGLELSVKTPTKNQGMVAGTFAQESIKPGQDSLWLPEAFILVA